LTTRAVLLGVVICAIAISLAYPVRQYLGQRAEIAHLEASQAAQRQRVAQLEARAAQLDDPAYIRAQARTRLHYVDPGETAYVVVAATPPPAHRPATDARAAPAPAGQPWYSQLWSSTAAAGAGKSGAGKSGAGKSGAGP
jgi:cell division protein FtsB